jgi:DNA-binding PadR family transcriptional regulator
MRDDERDFMGPRPFHRPFMGPGAPFGPQMRFFGPGGPGGPGFGMRGRRRRRGDVRHAVLDALAERPMHGYEIMSWLEEKSGGRWRPSPGSVYPTLQLLEDEGLIAGADDGGRRVYSITEAGTAARAARPRGGPSWEGGEDDSPRMKLAQLAMGTHEAAMQVVRLGTDDQLQRVSSILAQARRSIYAVLAEDEPAPTDT